MPGLTAGPARSIVAWCGVLASHGSACSWRPAPWQRSRARGRSPTRGRRRCRRRSRARPSTPRSGPGKVRFRLPGHDRLRRAHRAPAAADRDDLRHHRRARDADLGGRHARAPPSTRGSTRAPSRSARRRGRSRSRRSRSPGRCPAAPRARGRARRRQAQAAPPVGRRQGPLPHRRALQLGDGARHALGRLGPLRRDAHARRARRGHGPRPRAPQDRDRPRRRAVPRARAGERDAVSWVSVFAGFLVAHMVGDYLLQTDWQARHKRGGLSDPAARRPLRDPRRDLHARLRARLRVDRERARRRLGASSPPLLVFVPHLVVDDGRIVRALPRRASSTSRASTSASPRRSTSPSTCSRCGSWRCCWGPREPARAPAAHAAAARRDGGHRRRRRWRSSAPTRCSAWSTRASTSASRSADSSRRRTTSSSSAIDDKTFDELDVRWPRSGASYHARVIRNLTRAGRQGDRLRRPVHRARPTDDADDDALILAVARAPAHGAWRRPRSSETGTTQHLRRRRTGLRYSRAIPANSNYVNDSDGRIRHVAFKLDGLQTFPVAARAPSGQLGAASSTCRPATAPGSTSRATRRASTGSASRRLQGQVRPGDGARQDRRRRRHRRPSTRTCTRPRPPAAALMPGPEIQASAIVTALEGFPIKDAPQLARHPAARRARACSRRSPRCACGSSRRWPSACSRWPAFLVGAQIAFNHGTGADGRLPGARRHRRPPGHRRSSTASPSPSSASRRATPSRASSPRPSSTRCCAAPTGSGSAACSARARSCSATCAASPRSPRRSSRRRSSAP